MIIDTLQESINGQKHDVAPVTVFDAVKETDALGSKNLTEIIKDMKSLQRNESCITILTWADGNLTGESRVGKFVTFSDGTNKVRVATTGDMVCGVVVDPVNYLEIYPEIVNDTSLVLVCLLGRIPVNCRTGYTTNDLAIGKKVIVSEAGNSIISDTGFGFPVLDIIDADTIQILFIPYMDIYSQMVDKVNKLYNRFPDSFEASITDGDLIVSHDEYDTSKV